MVARIETPNTVTSTGTPLSVNVTPDHKSYDGAAIGAKSAAIHFGQYESGT